MGRHDNAGTDLAAGLEPVPIAARLGDAELESLTRVFHTVSRDRVRERESMCAWVNGKQSD
jgi:hypothetical protein